MIKRVVGSASIRSKLNIMIGFGYGFGPAFVTTNKTTSYYLMKT